MNCSPTIAIALLLLSLSAGMWLLYKTQKENLNAFFKVVGWFVIVISLGSMICCGLHCALRCCMAGSGHCYERGMGECGPGSFNKRVMIYKGGHGGCEEGGKGCCKEGKAGCEEACEEGEENCCKSKEAGCEEKCEEKEEHKKDSVVVKK